MDEVVLTGGRITPGVVRVGDTVRRPRHDRSEWVNRLLGRLEAVGFPHAPRFLGIDDQGRDTFTYVPGTTTDHPTERQPGAYRRGGQMLRQLHGVEVIDDLLEGTTVLAEGKCIVHGDPGAYNTIFTDGLPVALIDWDGAHLGDPTSDLAYMAWTWCVQSVGHVSIVDQASHLHELAAGYGAPALGLTDEDLLDRVIDIQDRLIELEGRVLDHGGGSPERKAHAHEAIAWAKADQAMIQRQRAEFTAAFERF